MKRIGMNRVNNRVEGLQKRPHITLHTGPHAGLRTVRITSRFNHSEGRSIADSHSGRPVPVAGAWRDGRHSAAAACVRRGATGCWLWVVGSGGAAKW